MYEGLLSYQGRRAEDTIVGLVGKPGMEAEVLLTRLESLARTKGEGLGAALSEEYHKATGLGAAAKVTKLLAPVGEAERGEARAKLLAATDNDGLLADRLLPFYGIIRRDLRDLPVVIRPGALFVTESSLRKNTGTHYTPKSLAQQVADGALEPLVYEYGPLQTAERSQWRPKRSEEILKLKVADIAMGSAAFLVAACRYLAGALVEAWSREGEERARAYLAAAESLSVSAVDAEADPVMVEARRQIIEHCLYGVDINPMAVEMAKLSLWLVSMDRERPFTFWTTAWWRATHCSASRLLSSLRRCTWTRSGGVSWARTPSTSRAVSGGWWRRSPRNAASWPTSRARTWRRWPASGRSWCRRGRRRVRRLSSLTLWRARPWLVRVAVRWNRTSCRSRRCPLRMRWPMRATTRWLPSWTFGGRRRWHESGWRRGGRRGVRPGTGSSAAGVPGGLGGTGWV